MDVNDPAVSVVIPTHNRRPLLERALASVERQTFASYEIVVIDDGSTDGTAEYLAGIDEPRIRCFSHPNAGLPLTRNRGIALARGEWVVFLDDDDEFLPTTLEREFDTATRTGADAVYCIATSDAPVDPELSPAALHDGDVFEAMIRGWYPRPSGFMVRREILLAIGCFIPTLMVHEDHDIMLRLVLHGARYAVVPEVLVVRHEHTGERLGNDQRRLRDAYESMARELRPAIVARGGYRASFVWFRHHLGESDIEIMLHDPDPGRRAAREALVRLSRNLPWSAPSMPRPLAALMLGPRGYATARSWARRFLK